MARKPAPAKAHAEADATQSPTRRMQLPWWLRSNGLPRHVADPVEQVLQEGNFPAPLANLWAMVNLARAAEGGILTVRRDHGTKPDSMDPAVFVQNVIFRLRSARDELLKQTSAAHVAIVNARLDAFIGATQATLGAFMADDLDKIWCDNPTCGNRGKHLLPGPWIDAMARSREASEEASRLAVFVGGDASTSTPPPLPAGAVESTGPALTVNQSRVLKAMHRFPPETLLSSKVIASETFDGECDPPLPALGDETTRKCVSKLIEANLAERPEGERSGARLTLAGRKLAGKIAD